MSERNYYVICDDNCKFEGMTKEQIYEAIAEATGSTPTPVDEAFITKIKEQNANHSLKVWKGTEAQYNALEEKDADTLYIIGTNTVKTDILQQEIETLQEEVQPVDRGGTGATTAEDARENLGLSDAFYYGTKSISDYLFSANQYRRIDGIVVPRREGYRCFVLSVVSTSHSAIRAFNFTADASNGTMYIEAVNTSNSQVSGATFNIRFLYIKESMFAEA